MVNFLPGGLGRAGCLDQAILVLLVWPDSVLSNQHGTDTLPLQNFDSIIINEEDNVIQS